MRRGVFIPLSAFLSLPLMTWAQEEMPYAWQNYIELLSEEGEEETVEDLLELYERYRDEPNNLNDTANLLHDFPFVSDLLRKRLKSYVTLYGMLVSVEELYSINGFDSLVVEMLRPLVTTEPVETIKKPTMREILAYGRNNFVTGVGGTVEEARGYRDNIYEGNNLRLMFRYRFNYKDKIQLQISGDKDPGEAFFTGSQQQGCDFYGYGLLVNDIGKYSRYGKPRTNRPYIRRLAIGQYHAQFGQGLTLWSGFGPRISWETDVCKYAPDIRLNGAFTEYGYLRGIATIIALSSEWNLTVAYSYVDRDATLPRQSPTDNAADWVQSIYNSGYHRTTTEINKKHLLGEHLIGGHIEYHSDNLKAGMTGVITMLEKNIKPAIYVYNDNAYNGHRNINWGIDAKYRCHRLLLFGEAAICANNARDDGKANISPAITLGGEFVANNNHRASILARYYSPTYHNLHSIAVGQNSTPQNEVGVEANYRGRLPWGIDATATADFFYFPHMKYLVYAPSQGHEYRVLLSRPSRHLKNFKLSVRYRYKTKELNITPSTMVNGHYLLEHTYRHQLMGDIEYRLGNWRLTTRAGYTHYHGDVTEAARGLMLYQDVQFHPQYIPLTIAARVALFNINDYEARLYASESDFLYQYNSTIYQNEGFRCYLLIRYDINQHWNIGLKYGITSYTDKQTFGSGYDQIDGSSRQQWRIQMRLKW